MGFVCWGCMRWPCSYDYSLCMMVYQGDGPSESSGTQHGRALHQPVVLLNQVQTTAIHLVDNGLVCKYPHYFRPRQCNVLFLACSGQGCLTPPELWALGVGLPAQNLNSSQLVDRIIPTLTCWRSRRSKYCRGSDSLLESQKFVESCRDRGNTSPPPASVYSRVMTFMTASLHPEYLFYCPCRQIFPLAKVIRWFQSC